MRWSLQAISVLSVMALCLQPSTAEATPANRQAMLRFFGRFLGEGLDSCATCHVRANPNGAESLEGFPHNPFGDRLRVVGETEETNGSLRTRLRAIANEDADGDGVSNLRELLAGSHPGIRDETPELPDKELDHLERRFQEFASRYQWKPFEPVMRPDVPNVPIDGRVRNPIDRFLAAKRETRGLTPQKPVAPEILLRRVYLDLTGLSPAPDQIRNFLAEYKEDPGAYERVVDRLLEDPAYGERWGRHWMDIWRYSDWAGYKDQLRDSQRHIWHWRDWIVESLNEDKPYDRMILEMLAADEIFPEDRDALRATGYLARHYFRNRDQWMNNVVKHTSQGFLGITVGCAKCHDHMYDPITQREYYRMRAIFEPYHVRTERVPGELDIAEDGIPRAYDRTLNAKTWFLEGGDERRPVKDEPVPPGVPEALGGEFHVEPVSLPVTASRPDRRASVKRDLIAQARKRIEKASDKLQRAVAESRLAVLTAQFDVEELEDTGQKSSKAWEASAKKLVELQRQAAVHKAEAEQAAAQSAVNKAETSLAEAKKNKKNKGNASKAEKVLKAARKKLAAAAKSLTEARKKLAADPSTKYTPRKQSTYPAESNGRRLAFARWVVARENPLTARVAMNHIWLRHFGQAIVPTANEFGGNGREPTHPALLDWLAAEFMARDWSMKQMHRLIVTSAAYRMSSRPDASNLKIDPDNTWLWRLPTRRMEGEIVRDNLLHVTGRLDRTVGGPDISHELAQKSRRRSIYLRHAHEKLVEFVQIFDGPSVSECYMRETSVKPHQALALANSRLTVEGSRHLAERLREQTSGGVDLFINEACLTILGRRPLPSEADLCRQFLTDVQKSKESPVPPARYEKLITVLLNHNDFVAIR